MSIPTNQLVYAGVWSVTTAYPQYQFVQSPIDSLCYVNVGIQPSLGGPDPSVQPSAVWVLLNVPSGAGITSLNGLVAPAMSITSSDTSVSVTPIAPDTVDLKVAGGGGITSLNTLTASAISIVSSDTSVGITPIAPDKIDLSVAGGFAPAFGSFSSTQTQGLNPAFPLLSELTLLYDTKDSTSVGLTIALPTTDIQVDYKGVYKITASLQTDKRTGGNGAIDMYPVVNGTPVPNSATKLNINQNEESVMTVEWFVDMNANDNIRINCYSTADGIQALAIPASPPVPAIPSIITTILRIA